MSTEGLEARVAQGPEEGTGIDDHEHGYDRSRLCSKYAPPEKVISMGHKLTVDVVAPLRALCCGPVHK